MRFNTFDQVAQWYNNTKPLGGADNKGLDIRPIGARRYKHSRIKKYDENTYALLDGYFDPDFGRTLTPIEYIKGMSAVLWSRRGGEEYIRIRNLPVGWVNFARADFHQRYLPNTMQYLQHKSGKHEVRVVTPQGVVDYALPKTPHDENTPDDGAFLEFKRDGDHSTPSKWIRVSALIVVPSTRIDKGLKKQLKPTIEEFYAQMQVLAPMLDMRDYRNRNQYWDTLTDYLKEADEALSVWGLRRAISKHIPNKIAREILSEPEHEVRMTFMAVVAYEIGLYDVVDGNKTITHMREAYNRFMNTALGLTTTQEV